VHRPSRFTLISVSCLMKARCRVSFHDNMCTINYPDPDGRVMATIPESMGLYQLVGRLSKPNGEHAQTALTKMTLFEAHRKLGHIAYLAVRMMVRNGDGQRIILDENSKEEFCEACAKAKSARQPYPHETTLALRIMASNVHWDLWGPSTVKSLGGKSYAAQGRTTLREKLKFTSR